MFATGEMIDQTRLQLFQILLKMVESVL
jgi:hypothetical protein